MSATSSPSLIILGWRGSSSIPLRPTESSGSSGHGWLRGSSRMGTGLNRGLGEDEGRGVLGPAHNHQKEDEGEAEGGESRASAAPSLAHPRAGALAGERVEGTLQLLRRARQHRFGHGLPRPGPVVLDSDAPAPKPTPSYDLGALYPDRQERATPCPHRASLPHRALPRQDPR